ncbi:murein biosynthesis integral membrane protein MurJ [Mycobacterium cookii]|uniref:Putative peptidoglycan biosynthesis protein MviN n=1 Tax=Mycobacterium cookii TaxID=1775 RepID=A0A7I7KZ82_9MYCO|nr:murein biosynthesis integral membrane protein MurJ [Mycobacterium cookii]MCV7333360.1 murein biosynthesis integral membrane protein MurJ [Mycobacterium cookii]BBX47147.1 putative peptidoglycan biosynthesis protein MviN [Mycobacterium cookii]
MNPAGRSAPHGGATRQKPRSKRSPGPPTGPLPPTGHVPSQGTSPQPRPELSDAALVSRSWGMALATLVSRVTGFARIVVLAAILGAALSSAFSVANQLPNLVAALVLEATFTAIFVPVLARAEQDDADGGAAFMRRLVTLATAVLLAATLLSVAAAPLLVQLMLGRSPQVNEPLTTAFAYLLLPQVIFYGLSSVFMAILNTRNVFGPPAWAPVINNVVAIATLGAYLLAPGELSVDPVKMGNAKLLVLGIGTTLGVFAQTAVLLVAIRRQRISLRPLWGIDDRLKRFGTMAAAMVFYVLISQIGLIVTNQIASTAAASGPAIYNYTWLVLMLPFGMIGVTVLTVVMPRLSRNAAADDTAAVLADLSLAIRLTMITLIPVVAFMTVGGSAMGSALFAYGHFGDVDAGYLGSAIALSAFTLLPYAVVLLQLRVFYAREQPWIPIVIIVIITAVKIAASLVAPHVTDKPELVAGYLGLANGLGFLAGAIAGYILLRKALRPPGGHLIGVPELRTILVTITASLLAGLIAYVVDVLLGMQRLTAYGGGAGSLLRLFVLAVIMLPILAVVMVRGQVPEAQAAWAVLRRWIGATPARGKAAPPPASGRSAPVAAGNPMGSDQLLRSSNVTYPEHRNSSDRADYPAREPVRHGRPEHLTGEGLRRGPGMTDGPSDSTSAKAAPDPFSSSVADEFHPDVPTDLHVGTVAAPEDPTPPNGGPSPDPPRGDAVAASPGPSDEQHLVPGASIARGRYRLLVFHGGAPHLQFWQALDTALNRQVALTFVDPDGALSDEYVREILSRTMRLSRLDKLGIARVLDVVHTGTGGLVVSEWVRGGSLQEVAETSPSAVGAARAMQTLAAAAESAHHAGVALSIDHPSRVRVSIEGDVVLAFPATIPDANPEDDIRGIGAALYALLVNRWPLPESGEPSGMDPAPRGPGGQPVEPSSLDGDIPFQISAAATHSLHGDGGIRSAATLLNLLQQATAVADRTELLSPVAEETPPPTSAPPVRTPSPLFEEEQAHLRRRRAVTIGIGVGAAVIVVALVVLASVLSRIFGDVGGLDKDQLGLNGPSASSTASPAAAGSVVKPVGVTVFSPGQEPDNPGQARQAIDGNPATAWDTDTYHDAVPFPAFKSGVGLLLQLPQPTVVGTVSVDVPSTGTKIQIRSAATASPGKLDDTTALGQPVAMHPGHNTIAVNASSPTSYLLVWIPTLGTTNGQSRTSISELTVQAKS